MEEDYFENNRTPPQCRNGPIDSRSCTDFICCIMYILIIGAAIAAAVVLSGVSQLSQDEILQQLKASEIGHPLLALSKLWIQITLVVSFIVALCMLLVITTFIVPAVTSYVYVPLFLILMLLAGSAFLVRYFGQNIPLVDPEIQKDLAKSQDFVTLTIGIVFLLGFVASVFVICTKRAKFSNILPVLKISKQFFWSNCSVFIFSILFSLMTIGALLFNFVLLDLSQASKEPKIPPWGSALIILLEILWTHGFMQALSDFFFQSVAIHWYFRQRRIRNDEETCCSSLCLTLGMMVRHIGTIVFGHLLAYIPESLNTLLGRCENRCNYCYNTFCLFHRCTFRHLTKYCYIQTILQSFSFCSANQETQGLRKRTKAMLPELYMMGNFYISLAKIFVVMSALVLCYILIAQEKPQILEKPLNIVGPLLVTLLAALEISNHWMNSTGIVGDTLVFMYTVDMEIEKKDFGQMEPNSCPKQIRNIIDQVRVADAEYD